MQSASKEYIRKLLDKQSPIDPIPTGLKPAYQKETSVKSVIFDVYGTMLVSSSGDVDQAEMSTLVLKKAFDASGIKLVGDKDKSLEKIFQDYIRTIEICLDAGRKYDIAYPEIDVLSIWRIVLIHARREGHIAYEKDVDITLMACVFEFMSNKVYPMPHLKEVVTELKSRKIPIGIISNAQFYTPVLMNYFLKEKISMKDKVKGFDPELTVFSYKLGKGKPDPALYEEVIPTLKWKYGIIPSEVLFIGNDMIKDIYGGSKAGFKTVLFAGDKRSLRMYEKDERTCSLKPDHIIDDLMQVLDII